MRTHNNEVLIDQLVKSAAYACGCSTSILFTVQRNRLEVASHFGEAVDEDNVRMADIPAVSQEHSPKSVLEVSGQPDPGTLKKIGLAFKPGMQKFEFIAIAPLPDNDGFLIVADTEARIGMSAAQTYVLQTHATQIAPLLTSHRIEQLPGSSGAASTASMTERLRLLESVVVHANDAILITEAEPIDDPGPRIVYCNPAFTRVTGYAECEVIGRTPRILQNRNTSRDALDKIRHALSHWRPIEIELINARRDGVEFWVELSIVPVCDEMGWYTHWVSVQRDITERKQAEDALARARIVATERQLLEARLCEQERIQAQLTHAATHDALTKLRNRAFFMDRLDLVLKNVQSNRRERAAVLFMDLDRFKLVNDSLGHTAGDLLLVMVARRLESCLRPEDTLARIGGDEFVILVETVESMEHISQLADRLCIALKAPFKIDGQDVFTMSSIGIVEVQGSYLSAEAIIRDADIAMYEAKAHKTGDYVLFTEVMHAKATAALQLQTDLRFAIARKQFHIEYQCIRDVSTQSIVGLEALLRWSHPEKGIISPSDFIPIAEEIGIIEEVGSWVLDNSLRQMGTWIALYPCADFYLSVNVSAVQMLSDRIVGNIQDLMRRNGLQARYLQLEITENVLLHDPERADTAMQALRQLGIRIALDDFGTGFSSLSYIERYPIDTIKIDRSFILRLQSQPRALAIVNSIVQLGRELKLSIIAEGVESEEQLQILRDAGCRFVQGYLWARPEHSDTISELLHKEL